MVLDPRQLLGMALFALIFFCVACVLVGIGIVLGLLGCALAAVLLGLGVISISSSVFVGIRNGRAESAIRAFLIQAGIIAASRQEPCVRGWSNRSLPPMGKVGRCWFTVRSAGQGRGC